MPGLVTDADGKIPPNEDLRSEYAHNDTSGADVVWRGDGAVLSARRDDDPHVSNGPLGPDIGIFLVCQRSSYGMDGLAWLPTPAENSRIDRFRPMKIPPQVQMWVGVTGALYFLLGAIMIAAHPAVNFDWLRAYAGFCSASVMAWMAWRGYKRMGKQAHPAKSETFAAEPHPKGE
jgi:hypothetical protein